MHPRYLHGKVIALLTASGQPSVGIRWRIYGYSGWVLWLRSIDGHRQCKLGVDEFELFQDQRRIALFDRDPAADILAKGRS